jgi:hypothetical protein
MKWLILVPKVPDMPEMMSISGLTIHKSGFSCPESPETTCPQNCRNSAASGTSRSSREARSAVPCNEKGDGHLTISFPAIRNP